MEVSLLLCESAWSCAAETLSGWRETEFYLHVPCCFQTGKGSGAVELVLVVGRDHAASKCGLSKNEKMFSVSKAERPLKNSETSEEEINKLNLALVWHMF